MTPPERPGRPPILDADHPFFAPVWRRWATAVLPLAWAAFELSSGSPGWGAIFGALGAWAFWTLVVKGPSVPPPGS